VLSAFLIALREGVEAALVVGIILVYLARTGRSEFSRYVWWGVGVAAALSLASPSRSTIGALTATALRACCCSLPRCLFVSMIVWMNRVARHLRKDIEQKIERYAKRAGQAAGWGIFLFVF
jgi:high-affinity iron transporter